MKGNVITICCSASFYKQALEVQKELQKQGYKVKIPHTAHKMKKSGDFAVETYKTWFKNPKDFTRKAMLMRRHFKKILESDAILVLNYKKNDMDGYIGGNTLMEMALAFHYKKPIFVLNSMPETSSVYEEVMGMQPTLLDGDIRNF
ncbi:MAG: hypothetical protein O3C23_00425 [bacterium]|nr:hypothetical protein [bacterium]